MRTLIQVHSKPPRVQNVTAEVLTREPAERKPDLPFDISGRTELARAESELVRTESGLARTKRVVRTERSLMRMESGLTQAESGLARMKSRLARPESGLERTERGLVRTERRLARTKFGCARTGLGGGAAAFKTHGPPVRIRQTSLRPRTPAPPGHQGDQSAGITQDMATALKEF